MLTIAFVDDHVVYKQLIRNLMGLYILQVARFDPATGLPLLL